MELRMCYVVGPSNDEGVCYPIRDEDHDAQAWEDAVDKLHQLAELGGDDEWSVWIRRDVYDLNNCLGCDATDCPHRNAQDADLPHGPERGYDDAEKGGA